MTTSTQHTTDRSLPEVRPLGLWLALIALVLLLLCACGGGTDVAGVGSGGTGLAQGTVSGFGSVIVDGVEYDDSNADAASDDGTGTLQNTEVKLGQQVRLNFDASTNSAQSIEVMPQLVGPVDRAVDANGWTRVMGQWVRLVTSNADPTQSVLTTLAGYAGTGAIQPGDEVEVHGSWVYDASHLSYVLVATRLEKLSAAADPVQLGGVVFNVTSTGFTLNSSAGAVVQAASLPTGLSAGQVVRVWVNRSVMLDTPLVARRVARLSLRSDDLTSKQTLTLSGLPSAYDAVNGTVTIDGMQVRLGSTLGTMDPAALANGEYIALQVRKGDSGLVAVSGKLRSASGDPLGSLVQVSGITSGINWSPAHVSFSLRGTSIEAAAAVIGSTCRAVGINDDVYLQVQGRLAAPGMAVTATQVSCTVSVPATATVDRNGTVRSVDLKGLTMILTLPLGDITARWDGTTYFEKRPETLPGQTVEVEGVITKGSTELRLKKVKLLK